MSKDIAFYMDQVQDIFESVCVKTKKQKKNMWHFCLD